jgi:hypothetical protein
MISDRDAIRVQAFAGMDNRSQETRLAAGLQRLLVNLDVANGKLQQRPGYVLAQALPGAHSLWSDGRRGFCAAQGTLYTWDGAGAPVALRAGVFNPVSYAAVNGEIYFSDGAVTGKVNTAGALKAWGLPTPATPMVQATSAGGLTAGTYQVALTWQNATGEESGAALAATVQVAQGGGIAVGVQSPGDADVQFVNVYVSAPDSATLYHALLAPASLTSLLIGVGQRGRELDSQFFVPMPAGALVRFFCGRLVTAQGNAVTFSEPLRYGLTDARYGFVIEGAPITLLEPVSGGLFIGTAEGVRFAAGTAPDNFSFTEVETGAPVPGTGLSVDARDLGLNTTGGVAVWLSSAGWVYGLPDGSTSTPVADRLALPGYESGASMMFEQDGLRRMLAVVRGAGAESASAGDSVVAEVIRNGVVID